MGALYVLAGLACAAPLIAVAAWIRTRFDR